MSSIPPSMPPSWSTPPPPPPPGGPGAPFGTVIAPPSAVVKGPRRTGLILLGILVAVIGIGVGVGVAVAGTSQYEDAVRNLQRAPVGCDTEFNFTGTGTFLFYAETTGTIGEIRGDCENADTDYERDDDSVPRVTLTLRDADGDEVDLERDTSASYDVDGYVGRSVRSVTLDEPGEFTLSVESGDDDFAIAVGRNPEKDAQPLLVVGGVLMILGFLVGLVLFILGMRRKKAPADPYGSSGLGGISGVGPMPAGWQPGPPGAPVRPGPPQPTPWSSGPPPPPAPPQMPPRPTYTPPPPPPSGPGSSWPGSQPG